MFFMPIVLFKYISKLACLLMLVNPVSSQKQKKQGLLSALLFGCMFDRGVACVPGDLDFDGTVNELNIGN
jgi:hypothetical protein